MDTERYVSPLCNVSDVAGFFLAKGSMSVKKLQILVYYAYAWTMDLFHNSADALDFRLFTNRIEAWIHGPVIPDLYQKYKYWCEDIPKNNFDMTENFSSDVLDILNQV